ncbi:hypothetical protein [Tenacibaculum amylolyticum]|uniref:hypothetical protein n=1 Tax=Tenacibaculum amylolyticum TaxID=104269 RepID=UPI0038941657
MKKLNFKLERISLKNLELVKGCPTDINGNGVGGHDDDFNGDGQVDDRDQDYYDGYMDGYNGNESDPDCDYSDAYHAGMNDGAEDNAGDEEWKSDPFDFSDHNIEADIKGEFFRAPTHY